MKMIRLTASLVVPGLLLAAAGCTSGTSSSSVSVVSSSAPPSTTAAPLETISAQYTLGTDNATFFGRVIPGEKLTALEWTGSGVRLRFRGTGLSMMLGTTETDPAFLPDISVSLDDAPPERLTIQGARQITLAENLPYGEHTVSVTKVTEATAHPLTLSFVKVLAPHGEEAVLLPPPDLPARRILFIGDSITCGYGNIGKATSGSYRSAEQDGLQTYAAQIAGRFDADAHYVCYSGKGIAKNVNGDTDELLPVLFRYASPTRKDAWDFSTWVPDLVVINAGTNDVFGGASPEMFQQQASAFLEQIGSLYPDCPVIWCYGLMNQEMAEPARKAVEKADAGRNRMAFLLLDMLSAGEKGAVGHPNVRAHKRCADQLIPLVESLTGWEALPV